MNRVDKIEKLNKYGQEWCEAQKAGDTDRMMALQTDIFLLASEVFGGSQNGDVKGETMESSFDVSNPNYLSVLGDFFSSSWPKFDANKKSLYSYMKEKLGYLYRDRGYSDLGYHRLTVKDGDTENDAARGRLGQETVEIEDASEESGGDAETRKKRKKQKMTSWLDSLDRKVDSTSDTTLGETEKDWKMSVEDLAAYNDTALTFLMLHIDVQSALEGRGNNPTRVLYFRLFFTDTFARICQRLETPEPFIRHERDAFDAMRVSFLDFFMTRRCRTIPAIRDCPVKLHGEMVPGRPMEEAASPFSNDIYLTYLNTCEGFALKGDNSISRMREPYQKFLKAGFGLC